MLYRQHVIESLLSVTPADLLATPMAAEAITNKHKLSTLERDLFGRN